MENNEKEVLFSVSHLKKYFQVGNHATLKAVDDVSFEIYKGETLGMVGESGCGKTTCGRTCIGLYDKTDGQVLYKGTDVHALNGKERFAFKKQVQMVFQDPYRSLDPRMTVGESIVEGPVNFGVPKEEAWKRAQEFMKIVRLSPDALNRYPNQFSGGQRQRISIARALACEPEILICDEAVSALDVSVQADILKLLEEIQVKLGIGILFVTHDLRVASQICDDVIVIRRGECVESGHVQDVFFHPQHEYTKSLIAAAPGTNYPFGRTAHLF